MVDGYRAICLCLASVINSRCLSGVWGFYIYLKSSDAHEKNCNISCQPNILSAENLIFQDFCAVKVNGSDVNPGICARVFV